MVVLQACPFWCFQDPGYAFWKSSYLPVSYEGKIVTQELLHQSGLARTSAMIVLQPSTRIQYLVAFYTSHLYEWTFRCFWVVA